MAKRKGKTSNAIVNIIIGALVFIIAAVSVCCVGYVSRNDDGKWFSNSDIASWHWADNKPNADNIGGNTDNGNSNVIITGDNSDSGVSIYSAILPRSAYEANGISSNADTVIKLTATIKPDYAYNKKVSWAVKWQNESAEWAQGKTVTDYVTIDSVSDLEANATCLQAFGEPVEITCTIEGTDIKSTCMADYIKKVTDINVVSGLTEQADGSYLWVWNNYEVYERVSLTEIVPILTFDTVCNGVGTKEPIFSELDTSNINVKFKLSNELRLALNYLKTSDTFNSLTIGGSDLFYYETTSTGIDAGLFRILVMKDGLPTYPTVLIDYEYANFLTKCTIAGVDINVTVTARSFTKTFNINVVVSAESVDIPSDIEF